MSSKLVVQRLRAIQAASAAREQTPPTITDDLGMKIDYGCDRKIPWSSGGLVAHEALQICALREIECNRMIDRLRKVLHDLCLYARI